MNMTEHLQGNYIRYNPKRVDYTVSEAELNSILGSSQSTWKDFFIFLIALGLPCIINGIAQISGQVSFSLTLPIFLNFIIGVPALIVGICFSIAWWKTKDQLKNIIKNIKEKPEMSITWSTGTDMGDMNTITMGGEKNGH
jgi:hypothetical protein